MSMYQLVSSDSHIIEPADLWEKRIDTKFRERAPRIVREGDNDQWYCEGAQFGTIGTNQQAGLRFEEPEKLTREGSMDTVPLGGLDPHAHVKDMELDGVAGGVLLPFARAGTVEGGRQRYSFGDLSGLQRLPG